MFKSIFTVLLAATVAVSGHNTRSAVSYVREKSISADFKFIDLNRKSSEGLMVVINAKGLQPNVSYPYHIHVNPVPTGTCNCTATGGHMDPAKVKSADKPYKCDIKNAAKTCELGDLAGRHGNITTNSHGQFHIKYVDSLISFKGENNVLGHSVVIHAPDNTRLACANILPVKRKY
ncbi:hypothetical protein GGI12_003535 [Dipsacomyces acuminosporus]|nr:hypothetical protein GGI12_003535 [Dipsacomyces acuminosporus]